MTLILIVVCVFLLDCSVCALKNVFFPTDTDVFQELERDQVYKELFKKAAVSESRQRFERYSDRLVDARNGLDIPLKVLQR